ncbi:MAG: hypothetical protein II670_08795 [Alphaproteobacteria bacterium]|nr:hypothetical protein [Alphaproteobacteria bacterium]
MILACITLIVLVAIILGLITYVLCAGTITTGIVIVASFITACVCGVVIYLIKTIKKKKQ